MSPQDILVTLYRAWRVFNATIIDATHLSLVYSRRSTVHTIALTLSIPISNTAVQCPVVDIYDRKKLRTIAISDFPEMPQQTFDDVMQHFERIAIAFRRTV